MAQATITMPTPTKSATEATPTPTMTAALTGMHEGSSQAALSAVDLEKISQYQKFVAFRDTILAGKHPRIKVPASAQGRSITATRTEPNASSASEAPASSPAHHPLPQVPGVNGHRNANMQSFQTNSQQPSAAASAVALPGNKPSAIHSRNFNPNKTEFNPVLLEKSQDLIKAETHLQRQRIEKNLKDQVEERRKAALKATLQQPDRLQELDLTDILAKALTLVQATSAPITSDANMASNATDSGDSFDNNTFYSSQHVTPELTDSPRIQESPTDVPVQEDVPASPPQNDAYSPTLQFNPQPFPAPVPPPQQLPTSHNTPLVPGPSMAAHYPQNDTAPASNLPKQTTAAPQIPQIGAPSNLMRWPHQRHDVEAQVISSGESGSASRSGDSGNTDSDQPTDSNRTQSLQQLPPSANLRVHNPPIIRAHDLSPYAPQPAHVSPLAMGHQPPISQQDISILQAAPAPVAALRQQQPITSPESSPQGDKGSKKKNSNKKKNKRKAETRTHTAPGSPDIKPEPRSPSPLSAPHFTRPSKRQRPLQRQVEELAYDQPILDPRAHREYHESVSIQERIPYGWERAEEPYPRQVRYSVVPTSQRPEHVVYEDRRPERIVYEERGPEGAPVQYVRRIQSPPRYAVPYGGSEARPMRSASYSVAQPVYQEAPAYPVDGRTSVRPYHTRGRSRSPVMTDRRSPPMAPPGVLPTRIILDEYGHQYIEPPRPASTVRPVSTIPPNRSGEPEIIYERPSMRAGSRMPGTDTFEQDGILYRRASPPVPSRRVVTQPDYRGTEYRNYRERDYPIQPAREAPPQEYVQYGGATERRPEDFSREYFSRPISVRPIEVDAYRGRLQSTRPEAPPRQYTTSVRPDGTREIMPPLIHEYGARPTEADLPRREFSARPVERYYERPLPRDDEVTYIEQPRAAQPEVVYADPRGPVYHHG